MSVLIKYYEYFDKIYMRCCKMCVICSKVNFITNITNFTWIHTFYFYNNKHIFININTTFTTKQTNFIKINTNPWRDLSVPLSMMFPHLITKAIWQDKWTIVPNPWVSGWAHASLYYVEYMMCKFLFCFVSIILHCER